MATKKKATWGISGTTTAPQPVPQQTIQPFMTGDDLMALAQARGDYESNVYNLDYELEKLRNQTAQDQQETETTRVKGKGRADWDNAARGLATSSIRDAEMYDIDATAAIRKRFLETQLDTATLNTQRLKEAARHAFEDIYMQGLNQKMVENAQRAMGLSQ